MPRPGRCRGSLRNTVVAVPGCAVTESVLAGGYGYRRGFRPPSDARRLWLDILVVAPGVPVVYLLTLRGLKSDRTAHHRTRARTGSDRTTYQRSGERFGPGSRIAPEVKAPR